MVNADIQSAQSHLLIMGVYIAVIAEVLIGFILGVSHGRCRI